MVSRTNDQPTHVHLQPYLTTVFPCTSIPPESVKYGLTREITLETLKDCLGSRRLMCPSDERARMDLGREMSLLRD
jgi:hypothetical protein